VGVGVWCDWCCVGCVGFLCLCVCVVGGCVVWLELCVVRVFVGCVICCCYFVVFG
jgi:hypothetical protein